MVFFSPAQREFARVIAQLAYCNPFLPERVDFEREALGSDFIEVGPVWSKRAAMAVANSENVQKIVYHVERTAREAREALVKGIRPDAEDWGLYQDLVFFLLFHHYYDELPVGLEFEQSQGGRARGSAAGQPPQRLFELFSRDYVFYLDFPAQPEETVPVEHMFACFFQVRRAFRHIYEYIVGESMLAARLRAAIWQSIFTYDMRRYRRTLFARMSDVSCLITGPSGTGKELVARAIGMSRYIPFSRESKRFLGDYSISFCPLNLSALSPTLIESELFGHRRGAFTGALQDRAGWFEVCPPVGSVFLDEIGEVDLPIQVKLLRVLESRTFQRLGDTCDLNFQGKVIAATNRNLSEEIQAGRFRRDLYYRLCSDMIVTPSLQEQLYESASFLPNLVRFIAVRLAGAEEAENLADEILNWIESNLPPDYPWPGNFRELEQCARNIMIRRSYQPERLRESSGGQNLSRQLEEGCLTADELLGRYCRLVYERTGSYQETARRLELDHRTVKSRIQKGAVPDTLPADESHAK
jgi:transcriptional regulator with AAA-type ATPase domain